jgi:predicted Na+-dependent transporter
MSSEADHNCQVVKIRTWLQEKVIKVRFEEIVLLLVAMIGLHIVLLAFNYLCLLLLRLEPEDWKAVLILTSQKTLPIALAAIAALPPDFGDAGLIGIPCIIGHVGQLFFDSAIAFRWTAVEEKRRKALGLPLLVDTDVHKAIVRSAPVCMPCNPLLSVLAALYLIS